MAAGAEARISEGEALRFRLQRILQRLTQRRRWIGRLGGGCSGVIDQLENYGPSVGVEDQACTKLVTSYVWVSTKSIIMHNVSVID